MIQDTSQVKEKVAALLDQLSPKRADLVRLYFFQGKSQVEIAAIFKTNQIGISRELNSSIREIKNLLGIPEVSNWDIRLTLLGRNPLTTRERRREAQKIYRAKPEVKAHRDPKQKIWSATYYAKNEGLIKEYNKRPEVKAKSKEYRNKPEVKARSKEYRSKPGYKAEHKKYMQKYLADPNIKTRIKQQKKAQYAKKAAISILFSLLQEEG